MTATATAKISNSAFSENTKFATEIGLVAERIACSQKHKETSILKPTVLEFVKFSDRCVLRWHDYLSVSRLHDKPCLQAAFSTVSENLKRLVKLCQAGEKMHDRDYWTAEMQEGIECVADQFEDIQCSLAMLLDDDARIELQSILEEAGLDGRVLDRRDAGAEAAAKG